MSTLPTNLIGIGTQLFPAQEAMVEQMQVDYTQSAFQESTGAEILGSGLIGHMWGDNLHVSSTMSEQGLMAQHGMMPEQEQGLTGYLGAAIQDTINNYNPTAATIASHGAALSNIDPPLPSIEELASVQPIGQQMADAGYISSPTFEIVSNPTVSIEEIKKRIFMINDDGEYVKETDYLFDNIENRFNLMDFS